MVISNKGLDFVKDVLIDQGIATIIQSQLPQIEKSVQVPLVGKANVILSEITIKDIKVSSSSVNTEETGNIVLIVSGATANLNMNWRYTVSSWLVPIGISDSGTATVKVEDMEVGLTVNLRNQGGTLKLILLDYECDVGELSIKMNGGAAWLYQVLVDAFKGNIASAVEDAVSKKISEGMSKLDYLLQSLPKTISLDETSALNVSFVDNPVLSNSSIELQINGLFTERNDVLVPQSYHRRSNISVSSDVLPKMINISIHENVFKSASEVYFAADALHWMLDELPNQALLNTAEWKVIIPQLYKQYPNDDMNLNISLSSPPVIEVLDQDIGATFFIDIVIDVLEAGEVIPVLCISVDISASCDAKIVRNSLTGHLKLRKFSTDLKWSKIGKLHMNVIQSVTSTVLKTVLIPYLNSRLKRGFPLPIFSGFALKNTNILYTQPWIEVCTDVSFLEDYYLSFRKQPAYVSS